MKAIRNLVRAAGLGLLAVPFLGAAAPNRLLLTNCLVVTLAGGGEDPFPGYIAVAADGKISAIGRGDPPAEVGATLVFDADGQVAMPGFVSGHNHLRGSVSRGIACDRLNISNVFVAGNHVMAHGRHASIDMAALTREVLRRIESKSGKPTQ
jgi:cytosine/adenosine deaminase-related metal-dependent hydrolase